MSGEVIGRELLFRMTQTIAAGDGNRGGGLAIVHRYRLSCGQAWGGGSDLGYSIDIRVARDGSKAVVVARNNPTIGDPNRVIEKMYCPVPEAVRSFRFGSASDSQILRNGESVLEGAKADALDPRDDRCARYQP